MSSLYPFWQFHCPDSQRPSAADEPPPVEPGEPPGEEEVLDELPVEDVDENDPPPPPPDELEDEVLPEEPPPPDDEEGPEKIVPESDDDENLDGIDDLDGDDDEDEGGARSGIRTRTPQRAGDFKSPVSSSSTIRAAGTSVVSPGAVVNVNPIRKVR